VGIISKGLRINEEIRAREVRLIDDKGNQVGIVPLREALTVAAERHLDLVEVAPNSTPPVCRIMDYGRFCYEQSKKEKEARKRQKTTDVKEVRMTPSIDEHDFQVKVRSVQKFLADGDKVKITVRFRGREIVHVNIGKQRLLAIAETVKDQAIVEREPRVEGKNMIMILSPKSA
jgi:translation initiation factor IF-3